MPSTGPSEGIPVLTTDFGFGDEVLIDGVPDGEVPRDGQNVPVFNVLAVLKTAERSTLYLEKGPEWNTDAVGPIIRALDQEDIPWADWRPAGSPHPLSNRNFSTAMRSMKTPLGAHSVNLRRPSGVGSWQILFRPSPRHPEQ